MPPGLPTTFVQAQNRNLNVSSSRVRVATGAQEGSSGLPARAGQVHDRLILAPGPPLIGGQHPRPKGASQRQDGWTKAPSPVPPLLPGQWAGVAAHQQPGQGSMQASAPQVSSVQVEIVGNMPAGGVSEGFQSTGSAAAHGAILTGQMVSQVFQQVPSMNVVPAAWQH